MLNKERGKEGQEQEREKERERGEKERREREERQGICFFFASFSLFSSSLSLFLLSLLSHLRPPVPLCSFLFLSLFVWRGTHSPGGLRALFFFFGFFLAQ